VSFRSTLYVLFAALLLVSIVSSMAGQAGHADVPIAETADREIAAAD